MVSAKLLSDIGYDINSPSLVQIMTGNGIVEVPDLQVSRLMALGQERTGFSVLAHELSPKATIDGVLGLDFLRGHVLNIDFRLGKLTLE